MRANCDEVHHRCNPMHGRCIWSEDPSSPIELPSACEGVGLDIPGTAQDSWYASRSGPVAEGSPRF